MRPELEQYRQIDRYLNGELSLEEARAFEQALQTDPALAQALEVQKMVNTVILNAGYQDLKSQMQADMAKRDKNLNIKKYIKRTFIGTGILLLIAATWVLLPTSRKEKQSPLAPIQDTTQPVLLPTTTAPQLRTREKEHKNTTPVVETPVIQDSSSFNNRVKSLPQNDSLATNTQIPKDSSTETLVLTPIPKQPEKKEAPTITQQQTKTDTKPSSPPCSFVQISIFPAIEPSCSEIATGAIRLEDAIEGGTPPYTVSLEKELIVDNQRAEVAAGTYQLQITDKEGCTATHEIYVPAENCVPKAAFNPNYGEQFVFENKRAALFSVRIFSLAGTEVYYKVNLSDQTFLWEGTNSNGTALPAGIYVWKIEYQDGVQSSGQVTIIR